MLVAFEAVLATVFASPFVVEEFATVEESEITLLLVPSVVVVGGEPTSTKSPLRNEHVVCDMDKASRVEMIRTFL
jgi:hypothetical protein